MKNLKRFLYTFWIKKTQKLLMAPDTQLLQEEGEKSVEFSCKIFL